MKSSKAFLEYSDITGEKMDTDFSVVGKVSTQSVFKHTGKHWKTWISILEKAGAKSWSYSDLVSYLKSKHKLTPWWQQGVALGFEIANGKRRVGQDAKGKYMVTATKTLSCGASTVWNLICSTKGQSIWLNSFSKISILPKKQFETKDGFFGEIRTLKKNRRIRMYWQNPEWESKTVLEIMLVPRPKLKSILVFNHTGIASAEIREALQKRWRKAADLIGQEIEKVK